MDTAAVVDAIADSLEAFVPGDWTVQRFDPIWRDSSDGIVVYVFSPSEGPGQFLTNVSTEDAFNIVVQLVEPRAVEGERLVRDVDAEHAFLGRVNTLKQWHLDTLAIGDSGIHAIDYLGISSPPEVQREFHVRFAEMRLIARTAETFTYAP